jgi:hypothetical protein
VTLWVATLTEMVQRQNLFSLQNDNVNLLLKGIVDERPSYRPVCRNSG